MIQYLDFLPIWDGYMYAEAILNTDERLAEVKSIGESIHVLNYFSHPTMAFSLIMMIGQSIYPSIAMIHVINFILVVLSIVAYIQIVRFFLPKIGNLELTFAALIFAFNPLLFSSTINPNADLPVLVFFVTSIYSLLYHHKKLLLLSLIFLVFSKESGVLLYLLLLTSMTILYILSCFRFSPLYTLELKQQLKQLSLKTIIANSVVFITPLLLFLVYVIFRSQYNESIVWGLETNEQSGFITGILNNYDGNIALTRAIQIFLLNFSWIFTVFILIALVLKYRSKSSPKYLFIYNEKKLFLVLLILIFIGFSTANCIYNTFTNARYILPCLFFMCLFFQIALFFIFKFSIKKRLYLLCFTLLVLFIQVNKTIDPISKLLFGTIKIGQHDLLNMTSITDECCGIAGRDQLAYNAEFTQISKLTEQLTHKMGPALLVIEPSVKFHMFTNLPSSFTRQENTFNLKKDNALSLSEFLQSKTHATNVYYIDIPWMEDGSFTRTLLAKRYKVNKPIELSVNGYSLLAYKISNE